MVTRAFKRRMTAPYRRKKRVKRIARAIVVSRGSIGKRRSRRAHIKGFKNLMTRSRWAGSQIPQTLQRIFLYEQVAQLTSTENSGVQMSVVKSFRLNSIWDPDVDVASGQVSAQNFSMFLTSTGPYLSYRVLAAKVVCKFMNIGASVAQIQPVLYNGTGVAVTSANYPLSQVNAMSVLPTASEPIYVGSIDGGKNIVTRKYYVIPWQALGTTRAMYTTEDGYLGSYNRNPAAPFVMAFQVVGVNAPCSVHCRFKITYYVQLINPFVLLNRNAEDVSAETGDIGLPPGVDLGA